jgi:hypothetical protein
MRTHLPIWLIRVLIVAAVIAVHSLALRLKGKARRTTAPRPGRADLTGGSASGDLASGKPLTPK